MVRRKPAWAQAASDRARAATEGTPGGHGYRSAQQPEWGWHHRLRLTPLGAHPALRLLAALGCRARRVLAGSPSCPTLRPPPVHQDPPPSPLLLSREAPAHTWLWPQPLHPRPQAPPPTRVVAARTRGGDVPRAHIRYSAPLGTHRPHRDTPSTRIGDCDTLFHAAKVKQNEKTEECISNGRIRGKPWKSD